MTAATGGKIIKPACQFEEHTWCKTEAVYVRGYIRVPADTPGALLVFPEERCDCPCHTEARR
ncbi:hypothetical protein ADL06_07720 [Streptomyces sp. NRRL F-6491]|nr:hypothetical protein ADL06_07720 [Streptomyces sp. NRRL F-6491]KOX42305.1 hypothetical protein ADL08_16480 [Streptomyces sp. NRRL F-6492]